MLAITATDTDVSAPGGWRIAMVTRDFTPHLHVLSADERRRCDAVQSGGAADARRAAHILKREVAGARLGLAPGDVAFAAADGRPRLQPPYDATHVSLSHTDGAVAVAVAEMPIGVDIERIDRADHPMRLAMRYYAPDEARVIRASSDPHFAFAWRWTAKEALLKACGLSLTDALSTPLNDGPQGRDEAPCVVDTRGAFITVFAPAPGYVWAAAKLKAPARRTARTSH